MRNLVRDVLAVLGNLFSGDMKWWKIITLLLPIVGDLIKLLKDRITTGDNKIKLKLRVAEVSVGEAEKEGDESVIIPLHVTFNLRYPAKYFDGEGLSISEEERKQISAALTEGLDGRGHSCKECSMYVKNS